jgi:hypothetical protein
MMEAVQNAGARVQIEVAFAMCIPCFVCYKAVEKFGLLNGSTLGLLWILLSIVSYRVVIRYVGDDTEDEEVEATKKRR